MWAETINKYLPVLLRLGPFYYFSYENGKQIRNWSERTLGLKYHWMNYIIMFMRLLDGEIEWLQSLEYIFFLKLQPNGTKYSHKVISTKQIQIICNDSRLTEAPHFLQIWQNIWNFAGWKNYEPRFFFIIFIFVRILTKKKLLKDRNMSYKYIILIDI